jgi:hypothetical protein
MHSLNSRSVTSFHDLCMQDVIGEDPEDPVPSVMTIKSKINIYGIPFPLYAIEGISTYLKKLS